MDAIRTRTEELLDVARVLLLVQGAFLLDLGQSSGSVRFEP